MLARQWVIASILVILVFVLHTMTLASGVPEHLNVSDLVIETASGQRYEFRVYEAVTPPDRSRGLMYVEELGEREGMIFISGANAVSSMWMKNTPIPLDILFLRADGRISSIAADMIPYSRRPVSSREPVGAVLEVYGGTCEKLGIKPGDTIHHPLLSKLRTSDSD
jgi:uncharacterized membrane protein (UPF0127 family)